MLSVQRFDFGRKIPIPPELDQTQVLPLRKHLKIEGYPLQ